MRLSAVTLLALAVTGCTDLSVQRQAMLGDQERQVRELRARYDRDLDGPSFAILAGKIDLHEAYRRDKDPCAAIDRDRVPTAEESSALREWAQLRESFFSRYEAITMVELPGSAEIKDAADKLHAIMDDGLRSEAILISSLADGRLTYCEFAIGDKALTDRVLHDAMPLHKTLIPQRPHLDAWAWQPSYPSGLSASIDNHSWYSKH